MGLGQISSNDLEQFNMDEAMEAAEVGSDNEVVDIVDTGLATMADDGIVVPEGYVLRKKSKRSTREKLDWEVKLEMLLDLKRQHKLPDTRKAELSDLVEYAKIERFKRLGQARLVQVMKALKGLDNLTTSQYTSTTKQQDYIIGTIQHAVNCLHDNFKGKKSATKGYVLPTD